MACKRFQRSPSTIFSYAEGTRNNFTKHQAQNSPYKNLLIPRVGGIATALSAMLLFCLIYIQPNSRPKHQYLA